MFKHRSKHQLKRHARSRLSSRIPSIIGVIVMLSASCATSPENELWPEEVMFVDSYQSFVNRHPARTIDYLDRLSFTVARHLGVQNDLATQAIAAVIRETALPRAFQKSSRDAVFQQAVLLGFSDALAHEAWNKKTLKKGDFNLIEANLPQNATLSKALAEDIVANLGSTLEAALKKLTRSGVDSAQVRQALLDYRKELALSRIEGTPILTDVSRSDLVSLTDHVHRFAQLRRENAFQAYVMFGKVGDLIAVPNEQGAVEWVSAEKYLSFTQFKKSQVIAYDPKFGIHFPQDFEIGTSRKTQSTELKKRFDHFFGHTGSSGKGYHQETPAQELAKIEKFSQHLVETSPGKKIAIVIQSGEDTGSLEIVDSLSRWAVPGAFKSTAVEAVWITPAMPQALAKNPRVGQVLVEAPKVQARRLFVQAIAKNTSLPFEELVRGSEGWSYGTLAAAVNEKLSAASGRSPAQDTKIAQVSGEAIENLVGYLVKKTALKSPAVEAAVSKLIYQKIGVVVDGAYPKVVSRCALDSGLRDEIAKGFQSEFQRQAFLAEVAGNRMEKIRNSVTYWKSLGQSDEAIVGKLKDTFGKDALDGLSNGTVASAPAAAPKEPRFWQKLWGDSKPAPATESEKVALLKRIPAKPAKAPPSLMEGNSSYEDIVKGMDQNKALQKELSEEILSTFRLQLEAGLRKSAGGTVIKSDLSKIFSEYQIQNGYDRFKAPPIIKLINKDDYFKLSPGQLQLALKRKGTDGKGLGSPIVYSFFGHGQVPIVTETGGLAFVPPEFGLSVTQYAKKKVIIYSSRGFTFPQDMNVGDTLENAKTVSRKIKIENDFTHFVESKLTADEKIKGLLSLGKDPRLDLQLFEQFVKSRTIDDDGYVLILPDAHRFFTSAKGEVIDNPAITSLLKDWSTDPTLVLKKTEVVLLAPTVGELGSGISNVGKIIHVQNELPNEAARKIYLQYLLNTDTEMGIAKTVQVRDPVTQKMKTTYKAQSLIGTSSTYPDEPDLAIDDLVRGTDGMDYDTIKKIINETIGSKKRLTKSVLLNEQIKDYATQSNGFLKFKMPIKGSGEVREFSPGVTNIFNMCKQLADRGRYDLIPTALGFGGFQGTGKTDAALWLAGQMDVPLLELIQPLNKFVGESERYAYRIADLLKRKGFRIVLVDEADAVFPGMSGGTDGGASVNNNLQKVWNEVFDPNNMRSRNMLICSSARLQNMSRDMISRMDYVFQFEGPITPELRKTMLQSLLTRSKLGNIKIEDFGEEFFEAWPIENGRMIDMTVRHANRMAYAQRGEYANAADIVEAFKEHMPETNTAEKMLTQLKTDKITTYQDHRLRWIVEKCPTREDVDILIGDLEYETGKTYQMPVGYNARKAASQAVSKKADQAMSPQEQDMEKVLRELADTQNPDVVRDKPAGLGETTQ